MPEGDTVWKTAQLQNAALAGQVVTHSDIRVPKFATVDLAGETVRKVVSRGKHLFHRIGELSIHSHLKMEGVWRTFGPGEKWQRPAHLARAIIDTATVQAVGFELGMLEVIPTAREGEVVAHLGPDLLGPDWDAAEAVRRLATAPEVPVYVAVLDQRNLAGIGNVYANELCFVRGLLPTRPLGDIGDVPALVDLAERMLQANKDRWTRSTTGDLRPGKRSWVYGRAGQPCRRCGTRLLSDEIGRVEGQERQVTWCPRCQS
ncbi:MAG: DNA-formamidopyrimidine glycosylase family protein [Pseudolysinimonas sp.]|uniref:DNA-formamidopyrimidine glycosylase family protein n=1 Tax=Pseudolysinimonas sp. TaxID=2680009 RepID=UPI0032639E7E